MKTLDDYKAEMIGNTYGWLTVVDVFRNDSSRLCKCKCKCGNTVIKDMRKVYNGHTISCGCYSTSSEKRNKLKQSWADHPERRERQSNTLTKYYENHPETAELISDKLVAFYKNNPDKALERGRKYSEWAINNRDILIEQGKNHSAFYKDNPDVAAAQGKKISNFYKENPDKLRARTLKRLETFKNNPDLQSGITYKNATWRSNNPDEFSEIAVKNSNHYKNLRSSTDYSLIADYVHPDQLQDLLNGNITSRSLIKTRCPVCNEYAEHSFNNIFRIKTADLKLGKMPMCKGCYNSFTIITSKAEQEIADFISTFYNGECVRNSRNIISPLELDLYYPEKNIAIEFNGNYWHSSKFKNEYYHLNKFRTCLDNKIVLVSIFEYEWDSRSSDIKEYLVDLFNNKKNNLSYIDEHKMNNNYPLHDCLSIASNKSSLNDGISFVDYFVYDCGYTVI